MLLGLELAVVVVAVVGLSDRTPLSINGEATNGEVGNFGECPFFGVGLLVKFGLMLRIRSMIRCGEKLAKGVLVLLRMFCPRFLGDAVQGDAFPYICQASPNCA